MTYGFELTNVENGRVTVGGDYFNYFLMQQGEASLATPEFEAALFDDENNPFFVFTPGTDDSRYRFRSRAQAIVSFPFPLDAPPMVFARSSEFVSLSGFVMSGGRIVGARIVAPAPCIAEYKIFAHPADLDANIAQNQYGLEVYNSVGAPIFSTRFGAPLNVKRSAYAKFRLEAFDAPASSGLVGLYPSSTPGQTVFNYTKAPPVIYGTTVIPNGSITQKSPVQIASGNPFVLLNTLRPSLIMHTTFAEQRDDPVPGGGRIDFLGFIPLGEESLTSYRGTIEILGEAIAVRNGGVFYQQGAALAEIDAWEPGIFAGFLDTVVPLTQFGFNVEKPAGAAERDWLVRFRNIGFGIDRYALMIG